MHPEDDQHLPTILSHMLHMDCSNPKVKELIDVVIQARPSVAPQHTSPIIFILDGVSVIFLFPATCSMLVFCCFFTLIGRWVLCYYVVSPFLRPFLWYQPSVNTFSVRGLYILYFVIEKKCQYFIFWGGDFLQYLHSLPWENLPVVSCQQVCRMPSLASLHVLLKHFGHKQHHHVQPDKVFYVIDPDNNLPNTRQVFENLFRQWVHHQYFHI